MPVRAFFAWVAAIGPVEAEEALLALRIAIEPHRDPKRGDDGFVKRLQGLAGASHGQAPARPLVTDQDLASWGIKRIVEPRAGGAEGEGPRRRHPGQAPRTPPTSGGLDRPQTLRADRRPDRPA